MSSEQSLVAGRYRLGSKIGSGAMGVVWQARDERLQRTVAVKQLLSQPGLSAEQAEEARQRAMREGRIAARLSHPNAITVYDVAEHDGQPWLIMEYLPSKSLAAVLTERDTLPPVEAARIGAQVAAALVAAHAAGIVHRDIKPANVLLAEDGTVKITDFGISRATGDITVTATGMLAGTPAYLAPEVAKGETPAPSSDVFSLGSTLYTSVEGHSPFGLSENTLALLYAVAAGKISPPKQAGPLTALLMQLLRADPTERPSMAAARDGLTAVAAGKTVPAVARQLTDPYPKPPGRHMPPMGSPQGAPPPGTRLDMHPFSDPGPSAQVRQQRPMGPLGPMGPRTPSGGMRASAPQPQRPHGRPGPHGQQQSRQAPPSRQGRDVRSVVLTVLAIVAAVLVGILIASLMSKGDGKTASNAPTTTQQQAPAPATTTKAEPTTTKRRATTTAEATTEKKPVAGDYEKAVRDYYGLLPGSIAEAWGLLTPNAQAQSGDYDKYRGFYGRMESVSVSRVNGNNSGRVTARVKFKPKDDKESVENYAFQLVDDDGVLKIDSFRQGDDGGDG
ncbi:protein kinase domain-containing protein [Actinokineospora sp. 24-640]